MFCFEKLTNEHSNKKHLKNFQFGSISLSTGIFKPIKIPRDLFEVGGKGTVLALNLCPWSLTSGHRTVL